MRALCAGMATIVRFYILILVCGAACANAPVGGSSKVVDVGAAEVDVAKPDTSNASATLCVHSTECPNKTDQCIDGKCAVKVCDAGSKKCDGLYFSVCDSIGLAWTSTTCDDNTPCTVDTCDTKIGCVNTKVSAPDLDGDGFGAVACGGNDCNDANNKVNPAMAEDCTTVGVDDNCNGQTDEDCEGHFNCVKDGDPCGSKGKCSSSHCFWTDDKGYKWTLVPAGTFWMGCNEVVDKDCEEDEKPQHLVNLSAYWIGVYEVTQGVYQGCIDAGICLEPTLSPFKPNQPQRAVDAVRWVDAAAVCKWLAGSLPTEAQWEKAARGGCATYAGVDCASSMPKYPWGNTEPIYGQNVVFECNKPVGAGSKKGQSPYGTFDMAGNIWEKTLDYYAPDFYGKMSALVKDPVNAVQPAYGPGQFGAIHVLRGGACPGYVDEPKKVRASDRDFDYGVGTTEADEGGVRCVHQL